MCVAGPAPGSDLLSRVSCVVCVCPHSPKLQVYVGDGLAFLKSMASSAAENKDKDSKVAGKDGKGSLDAVVIDVNAGASDLSEGLSFPPQPFLAPEFLQTVKSLLDPRGALLVNFGMP